MPTHHEEKVEETGDLFIEEKRLEIAQLLLKHGSNPNAADAMQQTALHYAVISEETRCIELLTMVNRRLRVKRHRHRLRLAAYSKRMHHGMPAAYAAGAVIGRYASG